MSDVFSSVDELKLKYQDMRSRRDPLPTHYMRVGDGYIFSNDSGLPIPAGWARADTRFTAGPEGIYDNGSKRGSRPDFVSGPDGTYRRGGSRIRKRKSIRKRAKSSKRSKSSKRRR